MSTVPFLKSMLFAVHISLLVILSDSGYAAIRVKYLLKGLSFKK
jgi:hypothetical protein